MAKIRRRKSPKIDNEILLKSRRCCCICFGLETGSTKKIEPKLGQIAHLDHDPSNNKPENLAFLCHAHHALFDSRISQSKSFQIGEVKQYREELYQFIESNRFQPSVIVSDAVWNGISPAYQDNPSFIGRKKEIREFRSFLRSKEMIINYHGDSSVGKSWVLNHLLKILSTEKIPGYKNRLAHVDCKDISGDLLSFMKAINLNIGEKRFPNYIPLRHNYLKISSDNSLPQNFVNDLVDCFFSDLRIASESEPLVLYIDSFERVQSTVFGKSLTTAIKNHFGNKTATQLKVVIGSQQPIQAIDSWVRLRSYKINPFTFEELKEFANKVMGTRDSTVIDYLNRDWKGNPLELGQLVGRYKKDKKAIAEDHLAQLSHLRSECILAADNVLIKGLGEYLDSIKMDVLYRCAIPTWFDASALRAISNWDAITSHTQTTNLSNLTFIKRRTCGIGYEIHESYREPLLRNLIQIDRTMFQSWSELYYEYLRSLIEKGGGHDDIGLEIESVYHLMSFNEDKALMHYNDLRYTLGQIRRLELMEELQRIVEEHLKLNPNVRSVFRRWIEYGRANIHYQKGDIDIALFLYDNLLNDSSLDIFLHARVLRAKGDLLRSKGKNLIQTKSFYVDAIGLWGSLLKDNNESPGVTRDDIAKSLGETYLAIARIEEILGNHVGELNCLNSALKYYSKSRTYGPSHGEILRMIGRSLRFHGRWNDAQDYFDRAEKDFQILIAKAKSGDFKMSKRVEEIKTKLQMTRNAKAVMWGEEGKWDEAKEIFQNMITYLKTQEEKNEALGIAYLNLGDVLQMEGKLADSKDAYIESTKILKSEVNIGYPILGLAKISTEEGKEREALEHLSRAEGLFMKFAYKRKLAELELCRARLARKMGHGQPEKILESAWDSIKNTSCEYVKSAILIELCELLYETENDSDRFKSYHDAAMILARHDQRIFADHLARLYFLKGCISGKKDPLEALPVFFESLAWAARYNILSLKRSLPKIIAWLDARLLGRADVPLDREKPLKLNTRNKLLKAEDSVLHIVPERLRPEFRSAIKDLKRSILLDEPDDSTNTVIIHNKNNKIRKKRTT